MKIKSDRSRKRLIELRKIHGLRLCDVAKSLMITTSYYGMIETGVRNPRLELAQAIAEYFGVTVEEIFFSNLTNDSLDELPPTGTDN